MVFLSKKNETINIVIKFEFFSFTEVENLPPGLRLDRSDENQYIINGRLLSEGIFPTEFFYKSLVPPARDSNFTLFFDVSPDFICLLSDCDVLLANMKYTNITEITLEDKVFGYFSKTPQKIREIVQRKHKTSDIPETNKSYLICKNAFDDNIPNKDIHVSGHHRIILKSDNPTSYIGIQAFKLKECSREMNLDDEVTYYHIILENRSEGLVVNNLPVEDCID